MPANTGLSVIRSFAFRMASTQIPVRPAPTCGISSASTSSGSDTTLPFTVGTSSSLNTICEPKHSASTDRSIRLTAAAASTRSAIRFIPSACISLLEISSFTVIPISCTAGKDRIGSAFFTGAVLRSSSHCLIFLLICFLPRSFLFPLFPRRFLPPSAPFFPTPVSCRRARISHRNKSPYSVRLCTACPLPVPAGTH